MVVKFLAVLYRMPLPIMRRLLISIIGKLEGGQAFSGTIRVLMKKFHGIDIGIGSYGSCFNVDQTWTGYNNLTVGKFTSIARGVCIYTRNHPYERPSTSPLFYSKAFSNGLLKDTVEFGKLTIGNDVWIGQYAVILPSCHIIGDGAVIGAGSIVTKDVPDYSIVAGNPARVIKYRFDEETISIFKKSKWWDMNIEELKAKQECFQSVEKFKDKFIDEDRI